QGRRQMPDRGNAPPGPRMRPGPLHAPLPPAPRPAPRCSSAPLLRSSFVTPRQTPGVRRQTSDTTNRSLHTCPPPGWRLASNVWRLFSWSLTHPPEIQNILREVFLKYTLVSILLGS